MLLPLLTFADTVSGLAPETLASCWPAAFLIATVIDVALVNVIVADIGPEAVVNEYVARRCLRVMLPLTELLAELVGVVEVEPELPPVRNTLFATFQCVAR